MWSEATRSLVADIKQVSDFVRQSGLNERRDFLLRVAGKAEHAAVVLEEVGTSCSAEHCTANDHWWIKPSFPGLDVSFKPEEELLLGQVFQVTSTRGCFPISEPWIVSGVSEPNEIMPLWCGESPSPIVDV